MKYRTWLINEIYSFKPDVIFTNAKLFLYMSEGAVIQRLSLETVDKRVVEVFFEGYRVRCIWVIKF